MCCWLPLKVPRKDVEEVQEMTERFTAAKEKVSAMNNATAAVSTVLDCGEKKQIMKFKNIF